ncbi:hypothetical protein LSAT2_010133 [Lamellibrachia satsuma]|nr:hypothetical protein LSAT2_010133 [Lamellibrachia satsuma]
MFDVQLFVQTVLFFASCIAGAIVCAALSLTKGDFENNCLLYGSVKWSGNKFQITSYGNNSICSFILTIHGLFSLIIPFGVGCYFAYAVHKSYRNKDFAYKMWVMPHFLFASTVALLVLIASSIITGGIASFCHSFEGGKIRHKCSEMDQAKWIKSTIKTKTAYLQLQVTQMTSWVCLMLWLLQTGCCILRIIRNRRRLSRETDPNSDRSNIGRINPSA